nr:FAD-binding protein [Chitinophagaceae bacterium]
YSLVEQINGRGVFSFCMCPGGIIAPASTRQGALVVNGWSPSKRNNPFANSGMVVGIDDKDFKDPHPLAGLKYQYAVEKKAFEAGGGKFVAPAQRMTDFLMNKQSSSLPACSYIPGLQSVSLSEVLPKIVNDALVLGLKHFGQKLQGKLGRPGYLTHEAVLVATESRTSSPVRVPRHQDELTHPQITNLYPCAEGAGYAGGIVSAAMDGMRIAEKIYAKLHPFGH